MTRPASSACLGVERLLLQAAAAPRSMPRHRSQARAGRCAIGSAPPFSVARPARAPGAWRRRACSVRSAASASSSSEPTKHELGIDDGEERARREVEAAQHARHVAARSRARASGRGARRARRRRASMRSRSPRVFRSTRPMSSWLKRRRRSASSSSRKARSGHQSLPAATMASAPATC